MNPTDKKPEETPAAKPEGELDDAALDQASGGIIDPGSDHRGIKRPLKDASSTPEGRFIEQDNLY